MRVMIAILSLVILPSRGEAQVELARNDTTLSVGWAGSEYALSDYDRWRGSLFLSVTGGHYWTDHLKTEIEAGWSSRVNDETYELVTVRNVPSYGRATYRIRDDRLTVGQSYQFGRNAWAHPYVGAGADLIRRRTMLDRPAQTTYPNSPSTRPAPWIDIPAFRASETQVLVRPFIKTGVKMYASERMFFLTELKLGFAPDLDHALWKLGLGFDF